LTDRYNSVTVIFEDEIREDDLQHWIDAIGMMRKVLKVVPGPMERGMQRYQAAHEFKMRMYEALKDFQ
jgi:hypothetical protein